MLVPSSLCFRCRFRVHLFCFPNAAFTLLFALQSAVAVAQAADGPGTGNLTQPFVVEDFGPAYEGRVFSGGNNSAVYSALSRNATAAESVRAVLHLLSTLDGVVMTRRRQEHAEACNVVYTSQWLRQFRRLTPIFQIGSVAESCNSRIDAGVAVGERELSASVPRDARGIITKARDMLYDATLAALKSPVEDERLILPLDGNWTGGAHKLGEAPRVNDGQTCSLASASAYLRDGAWYLRSAVTNHPINVHMPDFRRHLLIEYVPVPLIALPNGNVDINGSGLRANETHGSMETIHPRLSDGVMESATALLLMWEGGGYAGTMPNDGDFSDPIAPVTQAFRENSVQIDQASDSVTISNIAILALPMAMTLIPLAFIADVTALGTLLYVLLTDVLSTIPFFVKGIELILWSSPSNEIVVSFHAGDDDLRLVEAWAVRCRGEEAFRKTGVVFVVVSIVTLVLGIALEIWAKLRMSSLQRKADRLHSDSRKSLGLAADGESNQGAETVAGPFGAALRSITSQSLLGRSRANARRVRKSVMKGQSSAGVVDGAATSEDFQNGGNPLAETGGIGKQDESV